MKVIVILSDDLPIPNLLLKILCFSANDTDSDCTIYKYYIIWEKYIYLHFVSKDRNLKKTTATIF